MLHRVPRYVYPDQPRRHCNCSVSVVVPRVEPSEFILRVGTYFLWRLESIDFNETSLSPDLRGVVKSFA